MMWPQAARVALGSVDGSALLKHFTDAVDESSHANGYTETGGGGLEMIGGADGIHALLLRSSAEGVLTLFPAWPEGGSAASFKTLRADGAFLVSASWDGTGVASPVEVQSEAGRTLSFVNPFKGKVCATMLESGAEVGGGDAGGAVVRVPTSAGMRYLLSRC